MRGNNNVYKTILKNRNKEYNEKHTCCFFTIWDVKSAITSKSGRVMLFLTSVYFAIRKLILLYSHSFHVSCIILFDVYFYIRLSCFPYFLIVHNQKEVLLIKWVSFFSSSKIFACCFQLFENGHIYNVVSTLISVMKLNVENL